MAPTPDSEHSTEKMRQVARSMRAELATLQSGTAGGPQGVGSVGSWDVPEHLATRVTEAHQAMLGYVGKFLERYEAFVVSVNQSAQSFDLSDQASVQATKRTSEALGPDATYRGQN